MQNPGVGFQKPRGLAPRLPRTWLCAPAPGHDPELSVSPRARCRPQQCVRPGLGPGACIRDGP